MAKSRITCINATPPYRGPALVRTAVSWKNDTIRIAFAGDLDADTAERFTRMVRQTLAASRQPHLQIDLAQVGFLAAAGIHALLDCQRTAARHGRRLTICNQQPLVRHVLHLTSALEALEGGAAPWRTPTPGLPTIEPPDSTIAARSGQDQRQRAD